eukprot:TRINITY_DN2807_c0_g1_i2.p1 TRINITY_DN2807_c0_g1~~TRINITY_DN2807_c0_g1_i2.p1  ORF type:complete len:210 (-),score=72.85 TRINITY_DN2807_c0_g1_i2:48-677(-)
MIRRPPRSTQSRSSAASDVYKRQEYMGIQSIDNLLKAAPTKKDPFNLDFTDICTCLRIECQKPAHILIIKLEKILFYSNFLSLKAMIEPVKSMMNRKMIAYGAIKKPEEWFGGEHNEVDMLKGPETRGIIFDLEHVTFVDYTAVNGLILLAKDFKKVFVEVRLSNLDRIQHMKFKADGMEKELLEECTKTTPQVFAGLIKKLTEKKAKK